MINGARAAGKVANAVSPLTNAAGAALDATPAAAATVGRVGEAQVQSDQDAGIKALQATPAAPDDDVMPDGFDPHTGADLSAAPAPAPTSGKKHAPADDDVMPDGFDPHTGADLAQAPASYASGGAAGQDDEADDADPAGGHPAKTPDEKAGALIEGLPVSVGVRAENEPGALDKKPELEEQDGPKKRHVDSSEKPRLPRYADGGKVNPGKRDMLVARLMSKAKSAKREADAGTKPLLGADDSAIAKALAVAQRHI